MSKPISFTNSEYFNGVQATGSFSGARKSLRNTPAVSARVEWTGGTTQLSGTFNLQLSWKASPSTDSDWETVPSASFNQQPTGSGAGSAFMLARGAYAPWARLHFDWVTGSVDCYVSGALFTSAE